MYQKLWNFECWVQCASNEMTLFGSPVWLQIIVDYLSAIGLFGNKKPDTAFICKITNTQNLPIIVFCLPFWCWRGRRKRMTVNTSLFSAVLFWCFGGHYPAGQTWIKAVTSLNRVTAKYTLVRAVDQSMTIRQSTDHTYLLSGWSHSKKIAYWTSVLPAFLTKRVVDSNRQLKLL